MAQNENDDGNLALSLVRGDLLFRAQRRIGLIPAEGLGLVRRAAFWALFAWLPIALWAAYSHRMLGPAAGEPLLAHFGVQVRCLVGIPLLIFAEAIAHRTTLRLLPHFVRSGLVRDRDVPAFRGALAKAVALRDGTLPWIVIVGVVLAFNTVAGTVQRAHEVTWAVDATAPGAGFGALWFLYVARPIYLALVAVWLWRVVLLTSLYRRLSALDLALVPTHPDRAGGLGFLAETPRIFAPVVMALGAVLASRWAHDIVYHGVHIADLKMQMGAYVVVAVALFSVPLLAFLPLMVKTKRRALLDYAALVGRHGRLVDERWIAGKTVEDDAVLSAPELGPVADVAAAYGAVTAMRVVLIGKDTVAPLLVAALLPLIPVIAIEIPIKEILAALAKALV